MANPGLRFDECSSDVVTMVTEQEGSCIQTAHCDKSVIGTSSSTNDLSTRANSDNTEEKGNTTIRQSEAERRKKRSVTKKHQCKVCDRYYSSASVLKIHFRIHTGERPYTCQVCDKCFTTSGNLSAHMRCHTGEKPYRCKVCDKSFSHLSSLNDHLRIHNGERPYQCKVCDKCFTQSRTLTVHLRTHTGEKPYSCNFCDKCFSTSSHRRKHVRTHMGNKSSTQRKSEDTEDIANPGLRFDDCSSDMATVVTEQEGSCVQASQCDKSVGMSSSTNNLSTHDKSEDTEDKESSTSSQVEGKWREKMRIPKTHQCKVCDKYYSSSSALKIHFRIHTGEKPYNCQVCDKYFTQSSNLSQHMRFHTGEKLHRCKVCDKSFAQLQSLNDHLWIHTGEKKYQCKVCDKYFAHSRTLSAHLQTHHSSTHDKSEDTEDRGNSTFHQSKCEWREKASLKKNHQCKVCDQYYSSASALKTHFRIHTGKRLYTCQVCDKCFTISGNLSQHMRCHTGEEPHWCKVCDKKFASLQSLIDHSTIHTGEKPYQCKVCDKCFPQSGGLTAHLRTHTGKKPYSCNFCDKCFSTSSHLRKHLRTHTGNKSSTQGKSEDTEDIANPGLRFDDCSSDMATVVTEQEGSCVQASQCDKSVGTSSLTNNLSTHHKSEDTEDKESSTSSQVEGKWREKMRIPKTHQCKVCDKYYSSASVLKIHFRIHTGEKPYTCQVCDKCFTTSGGLSQHMPCHTGEKPYRCKVCDKSFALLQTLNEHLRIHTGEKPYQCKVCDKCFPQSGGLTAHLRTHTGEKPYSCNACDKCFSVSSHLRKHMRTHTRNKSSTHGKSEDSEDMPNPGLRFDGCSSDMATMVTEQEASCVQTAQCDKSVGTSSTNNLSTL